MSTRLGWYAWYPSNWLSETRGWPLVARGAARELLDAQWDVGSLPTDTEELRVLIGATPSDWRTARPYVKDFFPVEQGRRLNADLEAERAKAHALIATRKLASQAGNKARWGNRDRKVVRLKRDGGDDA
jgi:uncharacterized protein YdaU (DUF1376 family)